MLSRRSVLLSTVAGAAVLGVGAWRIAAGNAQEGEGEDAGPEVFEVTHTDEEWRALLTPAQFAVLRREATERPFSGELMGEQSLLNYEHREGIFHCAGCDLAVYSSEHKYESGTGWPSFWQPISDEVIGTKTDYLLGYGRTEVHCGRCGGHFGHIFNDGPPPTGKRHCLNGLALVFRPAVAA
ncbi:MAG: peptide-methionine (R)-S-oxide reductase MsrB [Bauldia sp.]|nr:peptide-methionine (R)-S-oxide reductase MsrB [Bauldia sp.]